MTFELEYERLDVYKCALALAGACLRLIEALPRGNSELADQLRRAAISIPLNIAEGIGKPSVSERRRYHAIARGSAMEVGAIVDVLRLHGFLDERASQEAKELCARVVAMLTKMCR